MKKFLYGTFFLIFWIILNLASGWAQQPTGPKMELKEKYFNAKSVKEGQIIEHTFTVFNRGDRPLEIKKIQPG
jgi:adenine specific DNA methylase Mod